MNGKNKTTAMILSVLLLLSALIPASAQTYTAGEYTATTQGFGGDVSVTMTFDGLTITAVKAVGANETEGVGSKAIDQLPDLILSAQSAQVDVVAGATLTSKAVLEAADACIAQAKGEKMEDGVLAKGTYTAKAAGFYGPFDVTVTVSDTAIEDIAVGENAETPALGGQAMEIMKAEMIANNTGLVDSVSGATLTSAAFRNAVTDALKSASAPAAMLSAPAAKEKTEETVSTQVVVIGAGAAGYAAAISAREAGADVILLEKQGVVGGSTVLSAGIVYAALSEEDIPTMVDYYMTRAEGKADKDQLTYFAENSMKTIAWLNEAGVQWMFAAPTGTAPEARGNFAMNITGQSLVLPLAEKAEKLGVKLYLNTKATELVMDESGAVKGVKAEGKTANYTFEANSVVIATGGFDASEELKAQYAPIAKGDFPLSSKGNVGEGLVMGMAAGADTLFNGSVIGFEVVDGSLPNTGMSGSAMSANAYTTGDGTFISLTADYPITYAALKASGADSFYGLYDMNGAASADPAVAAGFGFKADTIEELAAACGADAQKLTESFAQANLAAAPYYAVVVKPATIGSMGGLKINTKAEVLKADGTAISGLYAAGEVANGGFYYQQYPASGSSISLALTYGREAGANAAALSMK